MRVSYLDAAILNLPQCEWGYVDGFPCTDPAIMFNTDARLYMCGPHHRFWEKHCQSHDGYEFGQLSTPSCPQCGSQIREIALCLICHRAHMVPLLSNRDHDKFQCEHGWHLAAPQTLTERVIEYMQKQGM